MGSEGCAFEELHGGKGFGVRNTEGERLLEFAVANDLVVENTRSTKRDSHLATYCSSIHKTQIDYILYRKSFYTAVYNVKVIPSEECAQQHNLLVCTFKVSLPKAKSATSLSVSVPGNSGIQLLLKSTMLPLRKE